MRAPRSNHIIRLAVVDKHNEPPWGIGLLQSRSGAIIPAILGGKVCQFASNSGACGRTFGVFKAVSALVHGVPSAVITLPSFARHWMRAGFLRQTKDMRKARQCDHQKNRGMKATILFPMITALSILLSSEQTSVGACPAAGFVSAGTFGAGTSPIFVAVGDFNGDGKPDLAVANQQGGNSEVAVG